MSSHGGRPAPRTSAHGRGAAWPGCREQALCASGNFGGELVCRRHFELVNGGLYLTGAEEHTHFHRDGSATVTRSAAGSIEEVFVRHIEAEERRRLREAHGFNEALEGLRFLRRHAETTIEEGHLDRAIAFLEALHESVKRNETLSKHGEEVEPQ